MGVIWALCILLSSALLALATITVECNNVPYQAAPDPTSQYGYNICNSSTENQSSLCQTAFINGVDDFCLWGPPEPVAEYELSAAHMHQAVVWCTKPGHGTRLIPSDAFLSARFIRTPHYVEVFGVFNQSDINYANGWTPNNEMTAQYDPRGADELGSPIGGLMFSKTFSSGRSNGNHVQAVEWVSQIVQDIYHLRVCDPNVADSAIYCPRWNLRSSLNNGLTWVRNYLPLPWVNSENSFTECLGDSTTLGLVVVQGTTTTYTGNPVTSPARITLPVSTCTSFNRAQMYDAPRSSTVTQYDVCTSTPQSQALSSKTTKIGAIVGGVVGSIAIIVLVALLCLWRWRSRRREEDRTLERNANITVEAEDKMEDATALTAIEGLPTSTRASLPVHMQERPQTSARILSDGGIPVTDLPPAYALTSDTNSLTRPSPVHALEPNPVLPSVDESHTEDELASWAAQNRRMISADLESKLRNANYLPSDNPDEVPADVWASEYGVGHFDLKRLRQLYSRRSGGDKRDTTVDDLDEGKGVHSSGQAGSSWRPST